MLLSKIYILPDRIILTRIVPFIIGCISYIVIIIYLESDEKNQYHLHSWSCFLNFLWCMCVACSVQMLNHKSYFNISFTHAFLIWYWFIDLNVSFVQKGLAHTSKVSSLLTLATFITPSIFSLCKTYQLQKCLALFLLLKIA